MIDRSPTRDTPRLSVALYEVAPLFGTRVAETILASVHVRAHQQAGHMDASDPITSPQKILQGGCRPHMTARRQHVEDGLHNSSERHRSRPASMRRRGHERFDQGPFGIGEVACVAQSRPAISSPSDFSPGHRVSVRLRKRTESQLTEIAQLSFSVRLLDFCCIGNPALTVGVPGLHIASLKGGVRLGSVA